MAWIMIDIFCWPSVIKFNYVAKAKRDVNSMWLVITHMGNSMYAYVYMTKERNRYQKYLLLGIQETISHSY